MKTDQLYQLDELIGNFDRFDINNDKNNNISRQPGIFKKVLMQWQCKTQTLFQFKQMYSNRLSILRKVFKIDHPTTIEDLSNDMRAGQLIGMLKRIQAKRIRAFEDDFKDRYENHKPVFSQNDTYQLEDQTGKVKLQFKNFTKINGQSKFNALDTPYGVIVKCKGQYSPRLNRFIVSNVQTPKPAPQSKFIPLIGPSKYMLVINEPSISDIENILHVIEISVDKQNLAIQQLVIIGGINYNDIQQIRKFDELLYELGAVIDVFVISSSNEQNGYLFPLSPIHQNFLRKSYLRKNVSNCSSPQLISCENKNEHINALISCGENIRNLKTNCGIGDQLQLMKLIIQYRHICASSIFSLALESYEYDPLILSETPHLMICGKCDMLVSEWYEREWGNDSIRTRLVGLGRGDMVRIDLGSQILETKRFQLSTFRK